MTGLKPDHGPVSGKTKVTVLGRDFDQEGVCNVTCRYSTTEVFSEYYDNTHVACESPPVSVPGDAIVQVALNGQQFTEYEHGENIGGSRFDANPLRFRYYNNPLITDFKPKSGPSSGNSTVIIYGAGFVSQNETTSDTEIWVMFNNTKTGEFLGKTKAYEIGLNEVRTYTPPAPAQTKAILSISKNNYNFFEIRGLGLHANDDYYTYYEAPHVKSIFPNNGKVKSKT
ncbi:MAG: IPT/TIG domain-containing protein, partial [Kangiellaceae bacterium]|nr:IPT/TIG domain-containing protein [Kangiellaceae bacterium]